ncbi:VWA domain-containing protein [Cryptosporangium aurantiacum]|uniref:Ca-activated chloride channel family protein n=1 Tax=Cryptosporangium aurantiacum TaxID=134849 RepID=A0A1M7R2T6_9ACTN|nr:VWA domain-containing protein [Cryptosporangium aurantiacum]SHN39239.1 Ca-activated chloride channel family protein [Cryptosporangium aurantiacum]
MNWLSPERLWLLLGVAALAVAYVLAQRRRGRYAVRFTNLRLLDRVAPQRPAWRRHVPAGLFLVMLVLLVVGLARPQAETQVPREQATVLVAVDVSRSMLASDVAPDRLTAAKDAAREFVAGLPEQFNVGLIGFAGSAVVLVPPSTDQAAMDAGIGRLTERSVGQPGTAIGDAIATSLDQIRSASGDAEDEVPPARVVVLSDGANTAGQSPEDAARLASQLGVPVDTIAFGTSDGVIDAGNGGTYGAQQPVPVDGQTLETVAGATGGQYYQAGNAEELREAYSDIGSLVGYEIELQDVSARFTGAGLVLAVLAALASLLWFARLP